MIILSWNIQKITADKARQFAAVFGQVVNEVVGDAPFVLIVYENKLHPDGVLDALGTGIHAAGLASKWVGTGGAASLRENILVICGNGASFDDPVPFTAWKAGFDERCAAMHQKEKDAVRAHMETLARRPARTSTAQAREQRVASVDRGTFRAADAFRCPVEITARFGDRRVRLLALHAPGPGDGADHEETSAHSYAEAIFKSAKGFDLILGDFNLRTHEVGSNGFVDQGVLLGATTKGREDGRHTFSRLDRVYGRPGFGIASALVSDGHERDLTDHHCLAVRVEPREQTLITDYFPFRPSPERRRKVAYENRGRALEARRRPPKRITTYEEARARRRQEAIEAGRRRRADAMAERRAQARHEQPG